MRVGLCGYPGAGKSTVFRALAPGATASKSGVAYGNIKVVDPRVDALATIFDPKKTTYAEVTFVDVGGGGRADTGAFPPDVVQHMRNVDVVVHVVRGFENPMLGEEADPRRDVRRFDEELVLLDLTILERRQERMKKEARKGREVEVNDRCVAHLYEGQALRAMDLDDDDLATLQGIQLLSQKPLITLYNLSEDAWSDPASAELRQTQGPEASALAMAICAEIEAEIAELPAEEQHELLAVLDLDEPARDEFVRSAYRLLDLISFLTAGPDECRAWPIRRGTVARRAAGKVHSDIERGFIRAEVYRWEDLVARGSEAALKAKGLIRLEGKEYVVLDGDVVNYRFNV